MVNDTVLVVRGDVGRMAHALVCGTRLHGFDSRTSPQENLKCLCLWNFVFPNEVTLLTKNFWRRRRDSNPR